MNLSPLERLHIWVFDHKVSNCYIANWEFAGYFPHGPSRISINPILNFVLQCWCFCRPRRSTSRSFTQATRIVMMFDCAIYQPCIYRFIFETFEYFLLNSKFHKQSLYFTVEWLPFYNRGIIWLFFPTSYVQSFNKLWCFNMKRVWERVQSVT